MAKQQRVKVALSAVAALFSVGFLLTVVFPEESEQLMVDLKALWHPPESIPAETPSLSVSKKKRPPVSQNTGEPPSLNLETAGSLELLGEELAEDNLWEEGILRERPEGIRSGQAVLDALNEIDGWSPIENGYNASRLKLYLRYPKVWVRISAYAFALKAKVLSAKEEVKLARLITLKNRDNPAQVRRFLTRYERKDPALFEELMKRLIMPEAPAPEEPATLEVEEDSADAS